MMTSNRQKSEAGGVTIRLRWLLPLLFLFVVTSPVAADWPQHKRDSARTGDAPEETLKFPMKRIVAVKFPSQIYASPAVVGSRVYVQDQRGNVACIDATRNKVLWATSLGGVSNHSSPAVFDGKVYIGSTLGFLAILDAKTGEVLKKVPGKGGVIASPAVANGAVYFSTFLGQLFKIDPEGTVLWKFNGGNASNVEFAVRGKEIIFIAGPLGGRRMEPPVAAYHLEDMGKSVKLKAAYRCNSRSPATGGPVFGPGAGFAVIAWCGEEGTFVAHDIGVSLDKLEVIKQNDRPDIKLYAAQMIGKIAAHSSRITPSFRGMRYYHASSVHGVVCEEIRQTEKGEKELNRIWQSGGWPYYGPQGFNSSPALAKNHLVLGCEDGRVYFFPLDYVPVKKKTSNRFQEPAWTFETSGASPVPGEGIPNGAVSSSPAIAGGRVFFGGEDGILYGLGHGKKADVVKLPVKESPRPRPDLKGPEWPISGGDEGMSHVSTDAHLKPPLKIKWKTRIWGSFKSPLIIADGKVFATARKGNLTVLDAATGEILWRTYRQYISSWEPATYHDGKIIIPRKAYVYHPEGGKYGGIFCYDAATGKELWRKHVPLVPGYWNSAPLPVHKGKILICWSEGKGAMEAMALDLDDGKELWRKKYTVPASEIQANKICSGVIGEGKWYISIAFQKDWRRPGKDTQGALLAVSPETGELLWKNTEVFPLSRGRLSYRKGVLVAFTPSEGIALDAKTGNHLWTGKGSFYLHALTDTYLESRGQKGAFDPCCGYYVFANGVWYGHQDYGNPNLSGSAYRGGKATQVWSWTFLGKACPTPSPAYGCLYYAPNDEGVVYCFENANKQEGE